MLVIAEMIGDLAIEGGLQNRLGQPLQEPALAGQLQPLAAGLLDELADELLLDRRGLQDGSAWSSAVMNSVTVSVT